MSVHLLHSTLKLGPQLVLLPIHLKWHGLQHFHVFKPDFGVQSTNNNNLLDAYYFTVFFYVGWTRGIICTKIPCISLRASHQARYMAGELHSGYLVAGAAKPKCCCYRVNGPWSGHSTGVGWTVSPRSGTKLPTTTTPSSKFPFFGFIRGRKLWKDRYWPSFLHILVTLY